MVISSSEWHQRKEVHHQTSALIQTSCISSKSDKPFMQAATIITTNVSKLWLSIASIGGALCKRPMLVLVVVSFLWAFTLLDQAGCAWTAKTLSGANHHEDVLQGRLGSSHSCGRRHSEQLKAMISQSKNDIDQHKLLYIVGGDEVEDEHFWPWSVALYELDPLNDHKAFICSGSLINDRFILTAAHCIHQSRFDILNPDEVFLKIASLRLDDQGARFYRVESIYVHPDYSVDRKANDIALLKLAQGQSLPPRAGPICLPSQVAGRKDFTDQQVTIIGWGKTSAMQGNEPNRLIESSEPLFKAAKVKDGEEKKRKDVVESGGGSSSDTQTNETLLQAEVRITSTDQCNRNYSKLEISWLNIDEHFICASDPHGKRDACQGDSGGPMMWKNQDDLSDISDKWYQIGLVSFGHGCANSEYPGVYTRISYYMPWILKVVNGRRG